LEVIFKRKPAPIARDAIVAAEVAIELLRSIVMGRVGEMVATSKFDTTDEATVGFLKNHFTGRKNRYCTSWIFESNALYLVDKIYCSPPPVVEEKIKLDWWGNTDGSYHYVTRNSYKRDVFPTDQDVFRITGEGWTIMLKADGSEVVYEDNDRQMWRSFTSAFDVEIMGDHAALGDDMLMFKLIGFDHITKGVL
jgi:hypothetical protein